MVLARLVALAVVILAAAAASGPGAATNNAPGSKVSIEVIYQSRPCANASADLVAPAPVTDGTLVVRRGRHSVKVSLREGQVASVSLPGKGAISATLVLETAQIRVVEGGAASGAERISLGKRAPQKGKVSFSVGSSAQDNGHVNTLIVLQRAARIAAAGSPRQLPLAVARVYDGTVSARPWTAFEQPNTIHVGRGPRGYEGTGDTDAQWEPAPLMHEYGHFLLATVAPDGSPGGDHSSDTSYPDRPNLAWGEGFPSAFAAVVLPEWGGRLYIDCGRPIANYAEVPARPMLATDRDRRYAQYSETRVAGATYGLVGRLGGGEAGLKRLLTALQAYRRAGHAVWTARDLRDLAAQEFEQSAADHAGVDQIFTGEGMSWSRQFTVATDIQALLHSDAVGALPELSVSLSGPGGFDCRNNQGRDLWPGPGSMGQLDDGRQVVGAKVAEGGLSFSADDDCYLISGDGTPKLGEPGILVGWATFPFPFLAGQAHWGGDFELRARYTCDTVPGPPPPKCPDTITVDLSITGRNDDPAWPRTYPGLKLGLAVQKTLVTFKAEGDCEVQGAGAADPDCGF